MKIVLFALVVLAFAVACVTPTFRVVGITPTDEAPLYRLCAVGVDYVDCVEAWPVPGTGKVLPPNGAKCRLNGDMLNCDTRCADYWSLRMVPVAPVND
jgi:hypothetical protein